MKRLDALGILNSKIQNTLVFLCDDHGQVVNCCDPKNTEKRIDNAILSLEKLAIWVSEETLVIHKRQQNKKHYE
jgi:hypothetical protein